MPVDPQIRALLDRGTDVPATHKLPVAEARRQRCIDGPGGLLRDGALEAEAL